jgi:hypothetical protein
MGKKKKLITLPNEVLGDHGIIVHSKKKNCALENELIYCCN